MMPFAISSYFKTGLILFVCLTIGYFVFNYKRLQTKTEELGQQLQAFHEQVIIQEETINQLQKNIEKQRQVRSQIDKELQEAQSDIQQLFDKINAHNLTVLANDDSELVQNKINKGTVEVIRCLEIATGNQINKDEKNNQCPGLISNN